MKDDLPTQEAAATVTVSPASAGDRPTLLLPERQFGSTRLIRRIGAGGMGEVWLGRHQLLGREVAIKFLLTADMDRADPAFQTFIQGAKVAASVEHPALNKVFHADVADGVPFLVLEFLDGSSLAEVVAQSGALSVSMVRAIIEPVCEAVAELHHRDLLHRDIKPSNIMLTTEGRVVLTDFGLARAGPVSALRSNSGGVAGTPAYMAPEMFDGTVSARTDVYAIGMTAYYLLCGKPAYSGSFEELQTKHKTVPINTDPLRSAGVNDQVIDVIVRATSKDILFRPKTARHVLEGFRTAFNAARIQPASRESLAHLVGRQSTATAGSQPANPTGPDSAAQTLAHFAGRKRELRIAGRQAPVPSQPLPASSHADKELARALRRQIWVARLVSAAVGSFLMLMVFGSAVLVVMFFEVSVLRSNSGGAPGLMNAPHLVLFRSLGVVTILGVGWPVVIALSTLIYRSIRGKVVPKAGDNTRCGWCQHELRGITSPVCSECGHRIGDPGPDEHGELPPGRRWGRRIKTWLLLPACVLAVFLPMAMLMPLVGVLAAYYFKNTGSMGVILFIILTLVFELLGLFGGMVASMKYYESVLQHKMRYSGRAWCRQCGGELRELAEPVCPACRTGI